MKRTTLSCLVAVGGIASLAAAGEDGKFIGMRGDLTGVFADCDPPVTWQEWKLQPGQVSDRRGKKKTGLIAVGDRPIDENIVWRVPMLSSCNGGMIVAGGKLFLMRDRGGIDFSTGGHVPDFLGSELVCLDPADGKVLWRRDCHHIDLLPAQRRPAVKADLAEWIRFWSKAYDAYADVHKAAIPFGKGGHGGPGKDGPPTDADRERFRVAADKFARIKPGFPTDLDVAMKHELWPTLSKRAYIQCVFWSLLPKAWPEQAQRKKRLEQVGYTIGRWQGQGSFCGVAMSTPASDGERIYVSTGNQDAFCFDLDGKLIWSRWFGKARYNGINASDINSVFLLGDVMVVRQGSDYTETLGLDKATGKTLWVHKEESVNYQKNNGNDLIWPVPLTLPDGKPLDLIVEGSGWAIRASDGKEVLRGLCGDGTYRPPVVRGDILIVRNGYGGGRGSPPAKRIPKGTTAYRLKATDADTVEAKVLWSIPNWSYNSGVIHDGLAYLVERELKVIELATGKVVTAVGRLPVRSHHLVSLAGGRLFWTDGGGADWLVFTTGRQARQVALNRLGAGNHAEYTAFNQGGQPFFSGNRMFYRSYTDVYCIGDPDKPTRLSQ